MSDIRIQMTKAQQAAIRDLRHAGFAVIVWHPEELGDADPKHVEDRSIEYGHEVIKTLKEMA